MDLNELKREYVIVRELGIDAIYGRILAIIDFGNVDYWFEEDRQGEEGQVLPDNEKLSIDLQKLQEFTSLFSSHVRFYYGHDPQNNSLQFIGAARHLFGKGRVFTKPIQKIRHYLKPEEIQTNTRLAKLDASGTYIHIPKCNFDVEITVDAMRLVDQYDSLALFSGDADFVSLVRFFRKQGKSVILFKSGNITSDLRNAADAVISAQQIKRHLVKRKMRKPGARPGSANR